MRVKLHSENRYIKSMQSLVHGVTNFSKAYYFIVYLATRCLRAILSMNVIGHLILTKFWHVNITVLDMRLNEFFHLCLLINAAFFL